MRISAAVIISVIVSMNAYSSGSLKIVPLEECVNPSSGVYVVKIIDSGTIKVKELEKFGEEISNQTVYHARIISVLNQCSGNSEESWSLIVPDKYKSVSDANKKKISADISERDQLLIMDRQNIEYSMIYYAENRHKIFYYYHSDSEVQQVSIGNEYIFVSDRGMSRKNGVIYGNVRFGLYPETQMMRKKIMSIVMPKVNNYK